MHESVCLTNYSALASNLYIYGSPGIMPSHEWQCLQPSLMVFLDKPVRLSSGTRDCCQASDELPGGVRFRLNAWQSELILHTHPLQAGCVHSKKPQPCNFTGSCSLATSLVYYFHADDEEVIKQQVMLFTYYSFNSS